MLGLLRSCGARVERHESQIRDENNGAGGVGQTMRAAQQQQQQQCCDKVGDDNEGERSVTKLSESVTIWSPCFVCASNYLHARARLWGDGNMKGRRKEDSAAGGGKIKKTSTARESLLVDCKKS